MSNFLICLFSLLMSLVIMGTSPATAENLSSNLLKQPPIEIKVSLGNVVNELKFEPNHLEFTSGKRYNLKLSNPSSQKHYFTAKDFADAIWTQKVEAGNVEIKGNIHELELKPGAKAEWVFVPMKPGKYALGCTIAGHTEAGMKGEIVIS
ncbi:MAG: biphenyl 2,3-dioxygenase [Aphanizomenon flos-aquae KM1D3_PB]|nr:cupredoxin domain-containing protein [Aphanizomenon sp. UHCC 0183]MTJ30551.1 biphenyl 2,3-dioxygenase [Aphanizomenon sp. UHCC 0183]QSV70534.1 MAG: biphenyl 2,3-dioxygenase [Aphanizomenon flos-aquae KM1D3_PB]